jgi:isoaspartyl peptidase/L-asparaginase-like protein (Ntn-hydrolase superfamily)
VKDYGNMTEEEKRKQNTLDITRAKETIGKVVQIEFREEKQTITEADRKARQELAEKALEETKNTPFDTVGTKYRDQYENIGYASTGGVLINEAKFDGYENITTFPYTS